jgi:hypothetical protein
MKLILLYYHTMSHNQLFSCLRQLNREILIGSLRSNSELLISSLRSLSSNPRSLRSIARNTIYIALRRQLAQNINKLQLPPSLKEYVLEFLP